MHRQSDDTMRSTLPDVFEESETDLLIDTLGRSSISITRFPTDERKQSSGSLGGDLYLEATGARRSSDTGTVLTTDTDCFMIGQRVWVGGIRPGQIAYIGETHFAPGEWAGIVLDEPNGKNDGCVAGKRYFQCEAKKGIFSRLTRLTLYPLPAALLAKESSPDVHVTRSIITPERSRTVSPTSSIRSSCLKSPAKHGMTVGDRVIVSSGFGSRPGILKYIGETKFAQGNWCGVQLDEPTGKNDGSVDGVRYFECPAKHGIFVPIAKVSLSPTVKKTRLSRAGSRESLTSVGTLNSIATTNTSRLRMGNSQKIPALKKPVNPARSNYSLQDIIREKQNHIEQIMIERELDREDSQNQALNFQKKIFELSNRVTELESQLQDEKKKSEDLQSSIDEATFCGDELTAQTQVYKEKIVELESQLEGLSLNKSPGEVIPTTKSDTAQVLLKEETQYLLNRIQELEKDAVSRGENYDKLIFSIKELEALNLELIDKCDVKSDEISRLKAKIKEKISLFDKLPVSFSSNAVDYDNAVKKLEEKDAELVRALKLNAALVSKESEAVSAVEGLTSQIANMKIEYDNNVEKYTKQIKDLEVEVVNLQRNLNTTETTVSDLQGKETQLTDALLKVRELEENLSKECAMQDEKLDALRKHLEVVTNENGKHKSLVNEYELKIKASQQQEAELQQALQKIGALEGQLTIKEKALRVLEEENQDKYKQWRAETENLEFLLNEKEITLKTLQEDMVLKDDTITNLSNKDSELEASLTGKSEECKNIQNDLEGMRLMLKESEERRSAKEVELSNLEQKFSELTKDHDLLNQKFADQTARHEFLLQEVNNLKNSSTTSQSEIISLTAHLAEKEEAHAKSLESANVKRVQVENELQKMLSLNEGLQDQLRKATAEKDTYANKVKQYEAERVEFVSAAQDMKEQINALQLAVINVEKGSKEKEEEIVKSLQMQLNKEVTEKDAYHTKCKQYESEKLELEKSTENLRQEVKVLQQRFSSLEMNSKAKEEELAKALQAQLDERKVEKDVLENKCDAYEVEREELQKSVEHLKGEINALQEDLAKVGKSSEEKEAELMKQMENHLNKGVKEKDEFEMKFKQSESEKVDLQKSVEALKVQISVLEQNLSDAEQRHQGKEQELLKTIQASADKEAVEKEGHEKECKTLEDSHLELIKMNEGMREEIKTLQQDQARAVQQYKAREEELVKQNCKLLEENKKHQLSLGDKEKEALQRNLMAEEIVEQLRTQLSDKDKELAKLRTDLQAFEKSCLSSEAELKQVKTNLLELTSNREGEINKIKLELKDMEEDQVDLVKENHDLKEHLAQLDGERNSLVEASTKEIQNLKIAEEMNAKLLKENDELRRSLEKQKIEFNKKLATQNENVAHNVGEPNRIVQSEHSKCDAIMRRQEEQLKLLSDKLEAFKKLQNPPNEGVQDAEDNDALSQINFLNSIIADMQMKNDTLKAKIDTLENFSKDFSYSLMFDNLTKRKPAPRVFCDMCDQFDLHDTEDCPIQCSESPVPFEDNGDQNRDKEKPPPRKYCENCEVFGHEAAECAQDETY